MVGEAALPIVSRVVGAASRQFQGKISPDALAAAKDDLAQALHIRPDEITDEIAAEYARQAVNATSPEAAARTAGANEFGIPLSKGQATGDMSQLAFEEAARNEARGAMAGDTVRRFDQRQAGAIANARNTIAEEIGGPITTTSQNELMDDVLQGVRGAAARDKAAVDAAYDAARGSGTVVKTSAVQSAGTGVRQTLDRQGIVINDVSSPYAAAALKAVDDMVSLKGALANKTATGAVEQGAEVAGVSMAGIDAVRQQIGRLAQNAPPQDRRAVYAVQRAFDKWLDNSADAGLLEGTKEGIELFKAARQARRSYATKYEATGRDADAGRVIERMLDSDVTPVEVANWLIGSAKAGERGESVRVAARLRGILGKDSPEMGQLKQAVWFKITNTAADGTPLTGPEAVARRIREFTSGRGEPYAKVLFSGDELGRMSRFAASIQQTVTPRNVRNPSGSGHEAARVLQEGAKQIGALVGGVSGGPMGATGGRLAMGIFGEARGFLKARAAVKGAATKRYDPVTRGAVSGGTAAAADKTPGAPVAENAMNLGLLGYGLLKGAQ